MLTYHLWIAFKSLKRNPFLSALLVLGVAVGIGVSTTFVTTNYLLSRNPIPKKSNVLHYVEMDNWPADDPFDNEDPKAAPNQVTYRDMVEIMKSDIPTYQSGMFKANLYVHPAKEVGRPFKASIRMCFADFFPMFEVPFQFGSAWDRRADKVPEQVVVLSDKTNKKLFGGEDSVGRWVRIEDREFKVTGVLQSWQPRPKFYDPHNGPYEETEELYMPLDFVRAMEIRTNGNTNSWDDPGEKFENFLKSEAVWLQMWVQLDTESQKQEYTRFLADYVRGQQALGRMKRPINNKLLPVMEWLKAQRVVPPQAHSLMIISLLFLAVCSVNLIGILLGKFVARAPEVGVRRALGASRRSIFLQHLIECEVIAILGAAIGILMASVALQGINRLFELQFGFELDLNMMGVAVLLALVSGLVAGIYPSWRICSIPPAVYLRAQ